MCNINVSFIYSPGSAILIYLFPDMLDNKNFGRPHRSVEKYYCHLKIKNIEFANFSYSGHHKYCNVLIFGRNKLRALKWHKPDLSIIISNNYDLLKIFC